MRLHINLDDQLVRELDSRIGKRKRSAFITRLIRGALDDRKRWDMIIASIGTISDQGHDWDQDPAAWVHEQRLADARRVG